MQRLIKGGPDFELLYNCSFYPIDNVSLERRRNVPIGVLDMSIAIIEQILYVPCLWSIWGMRQNACFKLMFVMGVLDLLNLTIMGPFCGFFLTRGFVFCSAPTLIYVLGVLYSGIYIVRALVECVLAANRCMLFISKQWVQRLFPDDEVWAPAFVLGALYVVVGKPFFYSSLGRFWMVSPHYGYHDEMESMIQLDIRSTCRRSLGGSYIERRVYFEGYVYCAVFNDTLMVVLPGIYVVFFLALWKKKRDHRAVGASNNLHGATTTTTTTTSGSSSSSAQKRIFIQVFLMVVLNCAMCFLSKFLCIYYFQLSDLLKVLLCELMKYSYIQSHGLPPIIYLSMNKTVQADCAPLVKPLLQLVSRWINSISEGEGNLVQNIQRQPQRTGTTGTRTAGAATAPVVALAPTSQRQ